MSKYNYKGIIETQKKEKIIEEYMFFSSNELVEILIDRDLEIESLNNIINELKKWLEEQHQFIIEIPAYTKEIAVEHKTMEICYENVLDKLQELKGDDK